MFEKDSGLQHSLKCQGPTSLPIIFHLHILALAEVCFDLLQESLLMAPPYLRKSLMPRSSKPARKRP